MASDEWTVPAIAFVDTSVLMLGLGLSSNNPAHQDCVDFLDEMEKAGAQMLVAAPTIAEMRRRRSKTDFLALPRVRSLVPVAFNAEHAHKCGDLFPWPQGGPPEPQSRTKFDLMIVATAVLLTEQGTELTFVTVDEPQRRRAEAHGLTAAEPGSFRPRQLRLVPPTASKASDE